MGARNMVIAGDFKDKGIINFNPPRIMVSMKVDVLLSKETIENYEVVSEEACKSAASGVARGLLGGALLGPVGMLAGGMSAKNKGIYRMAVQFKDGKRSLIEVDEKIYRNLMTVLF